ncbi:MAG TPA: FAD-linked oxidase C-terminal domain-containing protein [Saprospiraceae bacterium]|nr:FAD-linked oxidase C-terminal domain-containing protein [Saprospiraceae bacterium]
MSDHTAFITALRQVLQGDVHSDDLRRGIYATDASIYQIQPVAVVCPLDEEDVIKTVALAQQYKVPILARGGGTSLAGQTVGHALVLDFTKYMHQILAYDPALRQIKVQPGISRGELNNYIKQDRLEFAPDPATSTRAAIGGMIANNSSGTKSILYGKTSDHVLDLKVLLSDGTIIHTRPYTQHEIASLDQSTRERSLWKSLYLKVTTHKEEIRSRFPKTMRRVGGYCLDELLDDNPWYPGKIFLGSEGTLGIFLEATLNLVPLPKYRSVAVIHFRDRVEAIRPVGLMLQYKPAAVEILSKLLLDYSRKNLETQSMCGFIKGDPQAIQMVEFYGDTEEDVLSRPKEMIKALQEKGYGYAYDIYPDGETYRNVWGIRERGLGLLLGEPGEKKGVEFIEDAAIPVENLAEYIDQVLKICEGYGVEVTYYAHASVGVIHVRPILNLHLAEDIEKMKKIAADVFKLVVYYKGSWSSEHGDGLIRSSFLREFYGDTLYALFKDVKVLFDPAGILNPGKIVDAPPMDQDLRYGVKYRDQPVETVYHYRDQIDFHSAVHQCTGIGACRKISGGTMCPSYMVTRDEIHTTRGRANALRLAMSGQLSTQGLSDPVLKETLDLCVSCKACKAECPSSVDMARLKSEVLQMQYKAYGITLRDKMIRDSAVMAKHICGPMAPFVNAIQGSALFRNVLEKSAGFSRTRVLPAYSRQSFLDWFHKNYKPFDGPIVVLFADTYLNYYEPEIGKAAVRLINHLGYDVTVASGCCQRPRISHGFLELAKKEGTGIAHVLDSYLHRNTPVLVCEPSCASALTDDLPDMLDDKMLGDRMHTGILPIEKWVSEQMKDQKGKTPGTHHQQILLHGHCHQKALFGTKSIHHILKACGAHVIEPDSGCCGMAGSFGYEREHEEISAKMARRVLIPAIEQEPESRLVASGFSCRHQIAHFTGRKAVHWLEAIEIA